MSSLASYRGLPKMAGYCASKAGVNALLDSLRVELQPAGIAVTTICPGWIRTPLTKDLEGYDSTLPVDEAVRQMVWAIEKRKPWHAFPGSTTRRVRGPRWLPCLVSDWFIRTMIPMPKVQRSEQPQQV